ncbi:fumarylacetoacetate hydrolase family protein [Bradyrhizobium sp. CB1650]|uniref:2-keto-4-pentenoate hydratase n=1 Tax=Bradyrhizobium sp. CB1650 TaxID=3039153 RepID=UPI00243527A6|nr:fumarylacetoacetate hydrolase family protein [Bradyrhizobium sp. CB1650]WGD53301.1 fumarylacetoacetate hydrolase family protein [Bradyrhizobium sp. CB1650]
MSVPGFAERLLEARRTGTPASWRDLELPDRAAAYAVQDIVALQLGPVGGWKVGAADPKAEPIGAPCPSIGISGSPSTFDGPEWRMRGVEVEVGLRLGRDLVGAPSRSDCIRAVEALLPVVEVVETRLADWSESPPLAKLADFQSHGALVLGQPSPVDPATLDLRDVRAELAFNGQTIASTRGGNPASDVWRLLAWLARHAEARGRPLRAGDVITTGSCTGLLFAAPTGRVSARVFGLGEVVLHF